MVKDEEVGLANTGIADAKLATPELVELPSFIHLTFTPRACALLMALMTVVREAEVVEVKL